MKTMADESRKIGRLKDDELKKFIREFLSGAIYTSAQVTEMNILTMVFMPLALGALSQWEEEEVEKIGILWEYLDQAGPRAVNGCPIFFSMYMMHREDWKIAARVIDREQRRLADISLELDEDEFDERKHELEVAFDVINDGDSPQETQAWALGVLEAYGVLATPQAMRARSWSILSAPRSGSTSSFRSRAASGSSVLSSVAISATSSGRIVSRSKSSSRSAKVSRMGSRS